MAPTDEAEVVEENVSPLSENFPQEVSAMLQWKWTGRRVSI